MCLCSPCTSVSVSSWMSDVLPLSGMVVWSVCFRLFLQLQLPLLFTDSADGLLKCWWSTHPVMNWWQFIGFLSTSNVFRSWKLKQPNVHFLFTLEVQQISFSLSFLLTKFYLRQPVCHARLTSGRQTLGPLLPPMGYSVCISVTSVTLENVQLNTSKYLSLVFSYF